MNELIHILKEVIDYLNRVKWIFDFANVRILTDQRLDQIPDQVKSELEECHFDDIKAAISGKCLRFEEIDKIGTERRRLVQKLKAMTCFEETPDTVQDPLQPLPDYVVKKMSEKKRHEVSRFARFIANICQRYEIEHVIDVGSGLAYLPQVLSTLYNLNVFAIESSSDFIEKVPWEELDLHR